jgi:hypothetical protein
MEILAILPISLPKTNLKLPKFVPIRGCSPSILLCIHAIAMALSFPSTNSFEIGPQLEIYSKKSEEVFARKGADRACIRQLF